MDRQRSPYIPHPLLTQTTTPKLTENVLKVFLHGLWHRSSIDLGTHGRKVPLSTIKYIEMCDAVPCTKCSNAGMLWPIIWSPLERITENPLHNQLWEKKTCNKNEKQKWIWNIRFPLFSQWGWCVLHIKKKEKKSQEFSYNELNHKSTCRIGRWKIAQLGLNYYLTSPVQHSPTHNFTCSPTVQILQ